MPITPRDPCVMTEWTQDEWDNLGLQATRIQRLLAERSAKTVENPVWRLKLRLAIQAISGFHIR